MIYGIAEVEDQSVVKIGYTATPNGRVSYKAVRTRLSGLQVSTWRELMCIATAPGSLHEERRLHNELDRFHVSGEWFRNEGAVSEWLQRWSIPPMRRSSSRSEPIVPRRRLAMPVIQALTPEPEPTTFTWRGTVREWRKLG